MISSGRGYRQAIPGLVPWFSTGYAVGGPVSRALESFLFSSSPMIGLAGVGVTVWGQCAERLQAEVPGNLYSMWIRPLQADESGAMLRLLAPNRFIVEFVSERYLAKIRELVGELSQGRIQDVRVEVGSSTKALPKSRPMAAASPVGAPSPAPTTVAEVAVQFSAKLNPDFTFQSFVPGKSNQLALAACHQVADNLGASTYNPLFIYGPTGLGKTHLMHAVGNEVLKQNPAAKVLYLPSERFVQDFVTAMQKNLINDFKRLYRTLDVLLVDDIQFFAGKSASQEEFFHTFNALLEGSRQIILTSDKFPREINQLDPRLTSRFSWGLTVQVEAPERETRAAILLKKAEQKRVLLPHEVAMFIAEHIHGNVRELEGALNTIIARAAFTGGGIDREMVRESLRDQIALRSRQNSIENILKVVAEYYRVPSRELIGKSRTRSYARPRQVAMTLARELTTHSLPEIGQAFGGRDHTTVLHACRQVAGLRGSDAQIQEDYRNLLRLLQS